MNNETLKKFKYPELLVKDYANWAVVMRYDHITPGSLVIITKTDAMSLGDLSADAWAEFSQVSNDCECALRAAFGAEKFNYLALMMKDPNVHFHLIPRYSKPVKVNGKEFVDKDWPLKTELNVSEFTDADLKEIRDRLDKEL